MIASPTRTRETTRSSRQQTNLWLVTIPSRPLMPRLARHSRAGSDGTPQKPVTASLQLQLFLSCSCSCCSLLPCWTNHQLHCNHSGQSCPSIFNLRVVRAPFTYLTMAFAVVARELSCFAHRLLVAPITFLSSLVSHDLSHPRSFIGPASLSSRARLNSMQLSSPCLWPETINSLLKLPEVPAVWQPIAPCR